MPVRVSIFAGDGASTSVVLGIMLAPSVVISRCTRLEDDEPERGFVPNKGSNVEEQRLTIGSGVAAFSLRGGRRYSKPATRADAQDSSERGGAEKMSCRLIK